LAGPLDVRKRAKLAAELDREARWFQKAARHYRTREWAKDTRQALGITLGFLMDETQVGRSTIFRAEREEKTGAVTIGELEVLAEAMECQLVYAIVPRRGTLAEQAEHRAANPRKTRTEREKESREYREWYEKEVQRIRKPGPGGLSVAEMSAELLKMRAERIAREEAVKQGQGEPGDEGTRDQGTEGTRDRGNEGTGDRGTAGTGWDTQAIVPQGTDGLGALVRPAGAQRIRDAVGEALAKLGPEGEAAIRRAAGVGSGE